MADEIRTVALLAEQLRETKKAADMPAPGPIPRFVTLDSGERREFASGMVRDTDAGKPPFTLLFARGLPFEEQMLTRWAMLMRRGAEKYGRDNWLRGRGVEELERAQDSALRHMLQWLMGDDTEDHAAAAMANIMFAEYFRYRVEHPEYEPPDGV